MRLYECWVMMPSGQQVKVQVTADSDWSAKQILEAQYGASAVFGYPSPVA